MEKTTIKKSNVKWDNRETPFHIVTCILGFFETTLDYKGKLFESYNAIHEAFAITQGKEYRDTEELNHWLKNGVLSSSNVIIRKSSPFRKFKMSDRQMEILYNERPPSKAWRRRMKRGRNKIVNGKPFDAPCLVANSNKPTEKDRERLLKYREAKKARRDLLYKPSPESSAAKKCLFEYLKEKSGRTDGYTDVAIIDFCNDRNYVIPDGMTPTDWLVQLYNSKTDPDINENGPYTYDAMYDKYRDRIIASTKEIEKSALLESPFGKEMLEHYEELARCHGGDWYLYYNRGHEEHLNRIPEKQLTYKEKYRAYINSQEWRKFRASIIIERGSVCEKCSAKGHVDAHHLTYDRLFNEFPEDIMLLCKDCHKKEHGIT